MDLMKYLMRVFISLLVVLPMLFAGLAKLAPQPIQILEAWDKILLYETNSQGDQASPYIITILEYHPWRTDLWERLAQNEFSSGNYAKAVYSYQMADQSEQISARGLFLYGISHMQTGDPAAAAEVWMRLVDHPDVDNEMLAVMTTQLRETGDFASASRAAQRWSEVSPESIQAAWMGGLLLSTTRPADAIPLLTTAADGIGTEAVQARRLLDVLNQGVSQPNRAYQLAIVGQRLADLEIWDAAEQALKNAVRVDPDYAEAWALLGEAQQNLGKDGWNALLRAKSIDPNSEIVISAHIQYWKRQQKYNVALAYLRKLAASHPEDGSYQIEIGSTLVQAGDMVLAMAAYQRATEIEPDDAQNWQSLAVFSATYGFDLEFFALPAINKALELAPNDPQVLAAAGWVFLTAGDIEKAEQFLQLAIAEDEDFGEAKLHLAQIYIESNRLAQALPLLKGAVVQSKDDTAALIAQRLLDKYFPGQ